MRASVIFITVCFSVLCGVAVGQDFNRAKMDSLFALIEEKDKAMGSVSIFQDGVEVYQRSFGYADIEAGMRATKDTRYWIGSITKTFTASIIMQLVDEGKLTLETTLDTFFPEVPNASTITLQHLLSHRSGLYNFTNAVDYTSWLHKPMTREEHLKLFVKNGTVFSPGERSEYSNTNYVLLSFIAEAIDKKPYARIVEDRITKPFGLTNTYIGKVNSSLEAKSYDRRRAWSPSTGTDPSIPLGAGAIISTPTELNKFYHALMTGQVVSEASLAKMKKIDGQFGLGLFMFPFYNKWAYGHTGGIDGFQSNVGYFDGDKVSISLLTNGMGMVMNNIMIGVLSIYFGRDYKLPEFRETIFLEGATLNQYIGVYSSPSFPLKITITAKDGLLYAQATGQPSIPLEAVSETKFVMEAVKLELEFLAAENKMIFKQGPGKFELVRE